jgi:hypothetical protein
VNLFVYLVTLSVLIWNSSSFGTEQSFINLNLTIARDGEKIDFERNFQKHIVNKKVLMVNSYAETGWVLSEGQAWRLLTLLRLVFQQQQVRLEV